MALREHRLQGDLPLLGLTLGLVAIGLLMLASATWPIAHDRFDNSAYFLLHQVIFGLLPGVAGFLLAWNIPYAWYRRMAFPALIVSIVLLLLVFLPGIGAEFGSSRSWIVVGSFSLQPSEIVKLTFLFYVAAWMASRAQEELRTVGQGLLPFLTALGVVALLLALQPDTGSMGVLVVMALAVYFVAGAPLRYFFTFAVVGAVGLSMLIAFSPYRQERVVAFLHPEQDPLGRGYQINQAMLAIGSGGMWGRGYGHSIQKFQYLPEVASDAFFAVMAEELGFVVLCGFLALFVALLWRGIVIAQQAPDAFGRYVAVGVVAWIGVQGFVNMGAMVGVVPITGVPLPLMSYGGTALAVTLTALGVVMNISGAQHARRG